MGYTGHVGLQLLQYAFLKLDVYASRTLREFETFYAEVSAHYQLSPAGRALGGGASRVGRDPATVIGVTLHGAMPRFVGTDFHIFQTRTPHDKSHGMPSRV